MNRIITESERLLSRQFTLDDGAFVLRLVNSEGWIKYIGDRKIKTLPDAIRYLVNGPLKSYRENGFGLGLVELKSNNQPIGMCGLIKRDYLDEPDIGFAFLPEYTGKGYAYEIAEKTLNYGFSELSHNRILAITLPENYASIKLLEKIGLKYEKSISSKDTDEELFMYAISKNNNPART